MLFTFERNLGQYLLKLLQYCPLRIVLVVPFLLEVTSIVGLVGYLSDRSGNESVSYLVEQLMNQTAERIEINLKDFLQTPQAVLITNRLSLEGGLVNPQNQAAMERLFWQNIFTFDSLTDLNFASADDGFVAVGRDQQGLISPVDSIITVRREEGKRQYYLTDDQGKPQRIVHTQPNWDTRDRAWYKQGIQQPQDLEKANTQLLHLSRTDALTKVANRGEFDRVLNQEINRLKRSQQHIALLRLDVDFFKRYNDRYGHPQGDYCLIQVAQALKQVVKRSTDLVARYGGEEFVIILPELDLAGAIVVAEQIQQTVRQLKIPHEDSDVSAVVTVSMGIRVIKLYPHYITETLSEILIKQADAALYQAKTQGRDRYAIFS